VSDIVKVAIIAALAPTLTAVVGLIVALRELRDIHLSLNSRLDQLVTASLAQGRQDERDAQGRT
jgi:hypothetical protein